MFENQKRHLKHPVNSANIKLKNMNDFLNSSSQFDKNNSTTIDGTQVSIQQHEISLRTDIDRGEQAHNSMNLTLGKPT